MEDSRQGMPRVLTPSSIERGTRVLVSHKWDIKLSPFTEKVEAQGIVIEDFGGKSQRWSR